MAILNDNDIKVVLSDASTFFRNYSQQSLHIQPISQSLANLNGRLDSVTHAITEATKQAERNAQSSADLSDRLNRFTHWLVIATLLLALISFVQLMYSIVRH